jgi:hypothetical protein
VVDKQTLSAETIRQVDGVPVSLQKIGSHTIVVPE